MGCGAILHDLPQNVCILVLKALLVIMSSVAVNSNIMQKKGKELPKILDK